MKTMRIFSLAIALGLTLGVMAQKPLTDAGRKAQKEVMDHLRLNGVVPTIDQHDNSVCFKSAGVFYWITFEEDAPVLYTIHRKGLNFEEKSDFKPSCARTAVNEVNRRHNVKCTYSNKKVEFLLETYAKEPADFINALPKMLAAFNGVEDTYNSIYAQAFDQTQNIVTDVPGQSPLTVTAISFANYNAQGSAISDFDQPLRKSDVRYIKTRVTLSSSEKGIYKLGVRITNPEGKAMTATRNTDYSSTTNIEVTKANKSKAYELDTYGSDAADFWKAGEYKVAIFDFEKGAKLYETTFNIL